MPGFNQSCQGSEKQSYWEQKLHKMLLKHVYKTETINAITYLSIIYINIWEIVVTLYTTANRHEYSRTILVHPCWFAALRMSG